MFTQSSRHRSLFVYHLHMGGPDADALEWSALLSPRFATRLAQLGVTTVPNPSDADIVVLTGLLTTQNLDSVLAELARMPTPSVIVAAGDAAIGGGVWAKAAMPALAQHPISHYAEIHISVPGDPPTPQALIAALAAAGEYLARPGERIAPWQDE